MQPITHKLIAPSAFPIIPASKRERYAYQLGVSFCPSMDLVATYPMLIRTKSSPSANGNEVASDSEDDATLRKGKDAEACGHAEDDEESVSVDVWRFNSQRVFSITIGDDSGGRVEVCSVEWKKDGQIIAVLSSDATLRLVNSFNGKVVHRFSSLPTYAVRPAPASPRTTRSSAKSAQLFLQSKPTTLSYTTHFSDPHSAQSLLRRATSEATVGLDDLFSLKADINSLLKSPANLPHELVNIDVEAFLPRLSCLPPAGFGIEDVFSTRASIDAIFHSSKKSIQSGIVDVLVAGHNDGMASVRIFDSFEIGGVDLNAADGLRKKSRMGRVLRIVGWPFTSEVFVIAKGTDGTGLHFLGLDLKFITKDSDTLPILATKATQLQNLLRYLTQIQTQLEREVKTAFDLPARYIRNLNEDLKGQKEVGASFTTTTYQAIVAGIVSDILKDWLREQVGERGVKRWEKSVGDCLELTRRLVSEAWCPAVERAGVVISRLSGLAGSSAKSDTEGQGLGLDRKLIQELRDTINAMAKCGEKCLKEVIKEISGSASFIKWLKWEVEASALEKNSERLNEMREGSDYSEIMQVLEYIEQGPQESVVKRYLSANSSIAETELDDKMGFSANFKPQRSEASAGDQSPTFGDLIDRMRKQCDDLSEQIAQNLQQGIMTRYITQLAAEIDTTVMDVRVISQKTTQHEAGHVRIHVIARKEDDQTSSMHQVIETNGSGTKVELTTRTVHPPEATEVLDAKFVDDDCFMVLVKAADEVRIYSHGVETGRAEEWELRHRFKEGVMDSGMKPARLELNGRKKRRVLGVVDETGKGYVVFDLDSGDPERESEGNDETMTG